MLKKSFAKTNSETKDIEKYYIIQHKNIILLSFCLFRISIP